MARAMYDFRRETRPFSSVRTHILEYQRLLSDCTSILDIGCGRGSPLRFLRSARLVGFDAYTADLKQAEKHSTHDAFVLGDARRVLAYFDKEEFDACVALDVIEHFPKEDGLQFLKDLEVVARKKVVILTPNGFLAQPSRENGDYQEHLSGWKAEEMATLGFKVIGLGGLKTLRTYHHRLRFRPIPLWAAISWISQKLWCRNHPSSAAALFCWKNLPEGRNLSPYPRATSPPREHDTPFQSVDPSAPLRKG